MEYMQETQKIKHKANNQPNLKGSMELNQEFSNYITEMCSNHT